MGKTKLLIPRFLIIFTFLVILGLCFSIILLTNKTIINDNDELAFGGLIVKIANKKCVPVDEAGDIWVYSSDFNNKTQLTKDLCISQAGKLSSDANQLLTLETRKKEGGMWESRPVLIDLKTGGVKIIESWQDHLSYTGFQWISNDEFIIYRSNQDEQLVLKGSVKQKGITREIFKITDGIEWNSLFKISPDGNWLAGSYQLSQGGKQKIILVNLNKIEEIITVAESLDNNEYYHFIDWVLKGETQGIAYSYQKNKDRKIVEDKIFFTPNQNPKSKNIFIDGYKVSGGMLTRDNITFISFEQTRSYGQGESILTKHVSFSEIVDKLIIDFDNPFLQAVSKNGIMTTISTDKGLYLANFSTKEITKICNNEQKCDSEFF